MAVHLIFLLILTGLTGSHSITTVSKVSVKAGDSITIPCLYESKYINDVKYLCKGSVWSSCSTEIRTDSQSSSEKFSISDDKIQEIFTVTIKDVTNKDTDYWCAVDVNGGLDDKMYFQLAATEGTPLLSVVNQEITGFKGEEITIQCHGRFAIKWCKLGSSCVTGLSGSIDGTGVTIRWRSLRVFTVTMSGLRTESSGWYSCVKVDFQMPVHVTVTDRPITTTPAMTRSLTTLSTTPNTIQTGRAITTAKTGQDGASIDIKSLIISLSLLLSVVMMALFIWFMLRKHKKTKAESSAPTTRQDLRKSSDICFVPSTHAEEEVTHCEVKHKRKTSSRDQEDATYCNVGNMRKTSVQKLCSESDVDLMYSSVTTIKQKNIKRVEAEDQDVTYSTLAQQHQHI
ncbi:uncharacterized protein LOC115019855 isoform X2 [Cottoperca gobio]|uniref:Uncharacterized protein LOC115019855 isoform X2 n=1 Tax=Cottoperca gobio TaxID=56716 RepID=A0A6J2R5B2_COTGO|nr:uncharacterized protein LOC115019855 isoform X2 [Cottoperca gobio]